MGVQVLREPLQVWLPSLGGSLGLAEVQEDMHRAFSSWTGQQTVWLLPWIKEPFEWRTFHPYRWELAIPSLTVDRIDVYHIGKNGYVWGGDPRYGRFPNNYINGLLKAWLDIPGRWQLTIVPAPAMLQTTAPRFEDQTVTEEQRFIRPVPCTSIPCQWPPDGYPLTSVFPEAESLRMYGALTWVEENGQPKLIRPKDPNAWFSHIFAWWPGPFTWLFPHGGGGLDELVGRARMAKISKLSAEHPDYALAAAWKASRPYITQGQTTFGHTWLFSTFLEEGTDGVIDGWGRFRLKERDLNEAVVSETWWAKMRQPVPIGRAWGVLGLFWALLLDALEGNQIRTCQWKKCGQIIYGSGQKKYCDLEDNIDCYRDRRRESRRQELSWKKRNRGA
jgi:hypothetical protein